MIRNYFVTAMRNIARHKVFSLFNIAGLAVGLAIFILAAQYGAFRGASTLSTARPPGPSWPSGSTGRETPDARIHPSFRPL